MAYIMKNGPITTVVATLAQMQEKVRCGWKQVGEGSDTVGATPWENCTDNHEPRYRGSGFGGTEQDGTEESVPTVGAASAEQRVKTSVAPTKTERKSKRKTT